LTDELDAETHGKLKAMNEKKDDEDQEGEWEDKVEEDEDGVETTTAGLKSLVSGVARVIKYYRAKTTAKTKMLIVDMWEGITEAGKDNGFGRKISTPKKSSFVGELEEGKPVSKGCFFKDHEKKAQGVWSPTATSIEDAPTSATNFASFDAFDETVVPDKSAEQEMVE